MRSVVFCLLLSALSSMAADKLRVLAFDGTTLRLGVSTEKQQYGIVTSQNRTNWVDRGRTWVLSGGTNEIVLFITLPASQKATFVKLVN